MSLALTTQRLLVRFVLLASLLLSQGLQAAEVGDRVVWSDVVLTDGRVLSASELRGKGVVVEFWATWCPFCATQNPHIQKLHAQHGGKGLIVLTFALDKDAEVVRKYMTDRSHTFAVAFAGSQSQGWFGRRRALPEVFVVGADGRIVFKELGEMFEEDIAALARFAAK